jgi:ABC-type transporter Mla MlaB component
MFRITVHDNQESLTFQLEGKLAGPWVREVEECRQGALAGRRLTAVRFDLAGVTFIDAAGKDYLAAMHRLGAEFIAADCLTKAIVAEITKAPLHPHRSAPLGGGQGGGRSAKAKARPN